MRVGQFGEFLTCQFGELAQSDKVVYHFEGCQSGDTAKAVKVANFREKWSIGLFWGDNVCEGADQKETWLFFFKGMRSVKSTIGSKSCLVTFTVTFKRFISFRSLICLEAGEIM